MPFIFSSRREPERWWSLAALDEGPDLADAPGVEEDVALADRWLLLEEARVEQRLADLLRQRPVVPREAAREVGEVGVVAAPLAHPVEPLEDAPRHAPGGIGVLVGS